MCNKIHVTRWHDSLTGLIDMTHWHDSLTWLIDMTHWHDSLTWLIDMTHWQDSLTWLIDMTHWHDSLTGLIDRTHWHDSLTWLIDMTHWHDSLTWLIDMTHWHDYWHDSFIYVTRLVSIRVKGRFHMCDKTPGSSHKQLAAPSFMLINESPGSSHSFVRVTWLIHEHEWECCPMNESCHTYKRITSHVWTSHVILSGSS